MSEKKKVIERIVRITPLGKAGKIRLSADILDAMKVKPGDYLKIRVVGDVLSAKKVE